MVTKETPKFDLGRLKGKYKPPSLNYVLIDEVNIAEEHRITAEVSLAIGLTFFGYYLSSNHFLVISLVFIIFGIIFLGRYFYKRYQMNKCFLDSEKKVEKGGEQND